MICTEMCDLHTVELMNKIQINPVGVWQRGWREGAKTDEKLTQMLSLPDQGLNSESPTRKTCDPPRLATTLRYKFMQYIVHATSFCGSNSKNYTTILTMSLIGL